MAAEPDFLKMPKTRHLLWTLCGLLVVLVAFGLGLLVGYRRAIFAADFGARYYRTAFGDPFGQPMIGAMAPGPMIMHGVAGQVIDVSTGTVLVRDVHGNEAMISVVSGTPVRNKDGTISIRDILPQDQIVVIGDPGVNGDVRARFIRILESTTTQAQP
jgi:hypothetical protein